MIAFLEAFSPSEWLTIGLVIFAGAQIWVTNAIARRDSDARREEADRLAAAKELDVRRADDQRIRAAEERSDADYQIVWAEQFRFESLASDWKKLDLISESAAEALDPALLLPSDWSTVASAMARMSRESAFLGAIALTHAHDTARTIARLNNLMRIMREHLPKLDPDELAARARKEVPPLVEYEKAIKKQLAELPLLYWDVLLHSPRAKTPRLLNFLDEGLSEIGQEAVAALSARSKKALTDPPAAG